MLFSTTHRAHTAGGTGWMKGSGALQVDRGVLAHKGFLLRAPACFIHYAAYVFVPAHVWMLGGQCTLQWFWQLFSLGFPVVKVKPSIILLLRPVLCPLPSNSVGDFSIQSALWFTVLQTSSSPHTSAFLAFMHHFPAGCFLSGWTPLIGVVVAAVRGYDSPLLPLSPLSFFVCCLCRSSPLCLEQESSCLHWSNGGRRWNKMKQGTLGIHSLFLENIQHLTLQSYFVVTSGTAV